jgi:hypothetical protein
MCSILCKRVGLRSTTVCVIGERWRYTSACDAERVRLERNGVKMVKLTVKKKGPSYP